MRCLVTMVTAIGLVAMLFVTAAPALAQGQQDLDSPKSDPTHHKVEFENDEVRVVRYIIPAHDKTAMHNHPSLVNVLFTDSNLKVTTPDGKVSEAHGKTGSAAWRGPTVHFVENIGDQTIEGILVEPKNPHSARPAGSADETKLPNSVAKVEFENEQVRVVRYRFEPGQKNEMHGHPDNVQIVLTDSKSNATTPDGKVTPAEGKAGQVKWRSAQQHSVQNTGDKPFEGILVEMKGAPPTGQ